MSFTPEGEGPLPRIQTVLKYIQLILRQWKKLDIQTVLWNPTNSTLPVQNLAEALSQVLLFVAPVRLCCFLGAWLAQMWTLGPTDALWLCLRTESTLCISRGLTLFIFLLVPACIHAVNVFSLEKHNRAAWIHLRCFQKPNSNLMTQKLQTLCCLSSGNSHLCGQWPFHSGYMLPLIYLWAWVVYFSISVTIILYSFLSFFSLPSCLLFVCFVY